MAVYENLSEEECYLYAILQDESGLDQAEFAYVDETSDDGIFRAWPFQWPWWRCDDELQIDAGSRSAGKSLSIKFRAFAFPFVIPGGEMVVTAPEGVHLDAVTDNIETLYLNNRLANAMLASGRSAIKHRPFQMSFHNGSRILGRIPQHDGSGVKGVHPDWLEQDEGSDYPESGWVELFETLKQTDAKTSRWRCHGVTRGVGGTFDDKCKPDSGWIVHRLPAMYRPTWSDEERASKVKQYGHKDNVDYRRNILGLPGDQSSPIFVLARLMQCADVDASSSYNTDEYVLIEMDDAKVSSVGDIRELIDLPRNHLECKRFWIGADLGWTQAPTVAVVFGEVETKGVSKLKLVSRLILKRISAENQVKVFLHLLEFYSPQALALDATGAGFPLLDNMQEKVRDDPTLRHLLDRVKGYNFSEKIIAGFDDTIEYDEDDPEGWKETAIKRNVLEWSTDILRGLVDGKRLLLPFDKMLLAEFQGQTWTYARGAIDAYGRKKVFSSGQYHSLDAARMAVLAQQQEGIEAFIAAQEDQWEAPDIYFL